MGFLIYSFERIRFHTTKNQEIIECWMLMKNRRSYLIAQPKWSHWCRKYNIKINCKVNQCIKIRSRPPQKMFSVEKKKSVSFFSFFRHRKKNNFYQFNGLRSWRTNEKNEWCFFFFWWYDFWWTNMRIFVPYIIQWKTCKISHSSSANCHWMISFLFVISTTDLAAAFTLIFFGAHLMQVLRRVYTFKGLWSK